MAAVSRWLESRLQLRVNREKSAVAFAAKGHLKETAGGDEHVRWCERRDS